MKQIDIFQAYNDTEELSKREDLTINAKWALYKFRKDLAPHYEFYVSETRNLLTKYDTTINGDTITFTDAKFANEYKSKQDEIDSLDVELNIEKQKIKLSDIPNITIQQIEKLDKFFEFIPE